MTIDTQIEKILETLNEYDKSTVQRALLRWQQQQIPAGYLTTRRQLSDRPGTGYMHPTEGWVSSNWPD